MTSSAARRGGEGRGPRHPRPALPPGRRSSARSGAPSPVAATSRSQPATRANPASIASVLPRESPASQPPRPRCESSARRACPTRPWPDPQARRNATSPLRPPPPAPFGRPQQRFPRRGVELPARAPRASASACARSSRPVSDRRTRASSTSPPASRAAPVSSSAAAPGCSEARRSAIASGLSAAKPIV